MQGHYNEHCLGLGRQALILHGSHRELEPFKPAEDPCYHSPSEVLTLPQLPKGTPHFCINFFVCFILQNLQIKKAMVDLSLNFMHVSRKCA